MWTCPQCDRIFDKESQPHSCKKVQLEHHFAHKAKAKELFEYLVSQVGKKVGTCQIISLLCCVHLFGSYDFLAALPKKDRLEIRFALNRKLNTPRLKVCVSMSVKVFKNCFDLYSKEEIDTELLNWLNESYHRK